MSRSPTRNAGGDLASSLALLKRFQSALGQLDRATLVEILGKLVGIRAPIGIQWQALADIAARYGEVTLARDAIDMFVDAQGGTPEAHFQKAALLMNVGAWREAHALLCTLPSDVPRPVAYAHTRGAAALYSGETDDARNQLAQATELAPQSGSSWYLLSIAADLHDEPSLAARLIAAQPAMEEAQSSESAAYYYALGRLYAGCEQVSLATAAFARAAQKMKSWQRYDRGADRKWAAESVRGYNAERIAAVESLQTEDTAQTIFVTGLPRSGTTLVAQILTSHSEVGEAAEIARLGLLAQDIRGQSWPELSRYLEIHDPASAARLWRHWMQERFPTSPRVVDKSVDASRFLGIAAALLPHAPIIWVRRDPLDCAWSCFRTCFQDIPWTNDLRDIAFHFRLEDGLLGRWQDLLGDRLLVVSYESLVAKPEPWIGRILRHCRLTEESKPYAPHESPSAIATPSVRQVQRAINGDSVGGAESYRAFLEPFIKAYSA